MIFDPLTNKLYTDKRQFLKQMHCPFKLSWEELIESQGNPDKRMCEYCERSITDTANLSDESLLSLVKQKPDSCLKIDFNQTNLIILNNVN